MKLLAAVLALSTIFALAPAHAHLGPSETSVLSVGLGSFIVVSVLPVQLSKGVAHVVSYPFRAKVTKVAPTPGKPKERTVEALTSTGEVIQIDVPATAIDAAGVGPGTQLVADTSQAGLIISANDKPFVLATGKDSSISKHVAL